MLQSVMEQKKHKLGEWDHKKHYGKVSILETRADTVLNDYAHLMDLLNYKTYFDPSKDLILKINLSWTKFFPSCSTPPWALDAVLKKLTKDGFKNIKTVENQTVVTHPWKGAHYNKWLPILERENLRFYPLTDVEWVPYNPKHDMLVMDELFDPILVPKIFFNSYMIHLPTMKTHGHTTTTGAMKNAFGGLIPKYRHHAHKKIHEVLVDLLAIQQEIHPAILAIMDGTVCGNGAGPRTMKPHIGNLILASFDQVAIDALAAKIMGFEPLKIPYIKMAHDLGLGIGDVDQLDIIGTEPSKIKSLNFNFSVAQSVVIKWDRRLRITTSKKKILYPLHKFLFYSPFFKFFIFGSEAYHDYLWYPTVGKRYIKDFLKTEWGELFLKYPMGEARTFPKIHNWDPY